MANLHDNRGFPSVCMEISNYDNHFALGFTQVETKIAAYFADLRIGFVKHVSLNNVPGGKRICTVRFDKWYRNPAADHLREKILSGRPARLVYDDPHSWELRWVMDPDYIQYGLWSMVTRIQSWWRTCLAVMAYEIYRIHNSNDFVWNDGEVAGEDATIKKSATTSYPSNLRYPSDFTNSDRALLPKQLLCEPDIQCVDAGRPSTRQGWMHEVGSCVAEDRRIATRELCDNE